MEKVSVWVGIQKRIESASRIPTSSISFTARTRPERIGIAPEIPPHKMLQHVRRFSQTVYTITSKNQPAKTTSPYNGAIANAQPTPRKEIIKPTAKTSL